MHTFKVLLFGASRIVFAGLSAYGFYVAITKQWYVQALLSLLILAMCLAWLVYDLRRGPDNVKRKYSNRA